MDRLSKKFKAIIYTALISGVICAVLRSLSLLFFYDGHIGYYMRGAALPVISSIVFCLLALSLAVIPFILFKKDGEIKLFWGRAKYFSLIPAVAFILPVADAASALALKTDVLVLLSLISALGALVFFALLALSKEPRSDVAIICGVCVIVYLALCWLRSYTDFLVPMNSPDKIFFNLGTVGAALLIIGELKVLCSAERPRTYFCYLSLAILSLFAYAVPYVVEGLGDVAGLRASTLSESAVLLALLIYACARAFTLIPKASSEDE